MLNEREVVDFLLQQRLLTAATVVDGDVVIRDVSRRNRNFLVISGAGPSFFVKQGSALDPFGTTAREAQLYGAAAELAPTALPRYLPDFHGYWPNGPALVLGAHVKARSLGEHQARGRFSAAVARALGRALACLHATAAPGGRALSPHGLHLHRPTVASLRDMSGGAIEFVKLVQSAPELCSLIDDVAERWEPDGLIHGDMKAANCLVMRDARGRGTSVQLVDWENCGIGDCAWDVGSVMGDQLSSWLMSIPATGVERLARLPELARSPLTRIRPALRAFWHAYTRGLDARAADRLLVRAARFAGIRLLQSASEQTQFATSLTPHTLFQAQVAMNTLRRPGESAVRLLGLSLRGLPE